MVAVSSRSNFWFVFFFALMMIGGICAIGFWMTYDIKCGGLYRVWTWTTIPPQFQCRQF